MIFSPALKLPKQLSNNRVTWESVTRIWR